MSNPVVHRIDRLRGQWLEFRDQPEPRVLRWLVDADELPVVEAFFKVECSDEAGECLDLFLVFQQPFSEPKEFARCLRQAFLEAHLPRLLEAERKSFVSPLRSGDTDLTAFTRTLEALHRSLELPGHIVPVLMPASVGSPEVYNRWLRSLARVCPDSIRVVVVDSVSAPRLAPLADAETRLVLSCKANLDMPQAFEEISEQAGGLGTAGGRFRHLWIRMANALGNKDLGHAQDLGDQAVGIAEQESWPHLIVAIHFALGAALTGAERFTDAIHRYAAAEGAAERAGEQTWAKGLRVKARLGHGSALLAAGAFLPAGRFYRDTVPLAKAAEDAASALESWRMASYCFERGRAWDEAWESGVAGLEDAKRLEAKELEYSTLPFLGEGLLRLTERPPYRAFERRIHAELSELIGKGWRKQVVPPMVPA